MDLYLKNQLELFSANYQGIRKDFIWNDNMTKRLAASLYALEGKPINVENIKRCHQMIKKEVGIFSSLRGSLSVYLAAALSLRVDPERVLSDTLEAYKLLRKAKFHAGDYLVPAAFEIAIHGEKKRFEEIVSRAREFYTGMRKNHRLHIGQDDYIYSVMLALSPLEVATGVERVRLIFEELRKNFGPFKSSNSILSLAQMLAVSGDPNKEEAIDFTPLIKLKNKLKKSKVRLDQTYTLPSLGILGQLPLENEEIAQNLIEARDFLRQQKGFSAFSVTNQELLMYAVSGISKTFADDQGDEVKMSLANNVTSLIVAQQVAMMVVIISASTASSAGR